MEPTRAQPSATQPAGLPRLVGLRTATLLSAGSMLGSGVFTTTGLLLRDLGHVWPVMAVWVVGGLLAAAGALAYAELCAALPENGGEYALLSRIYHPAAGFVAGWVSLVVGFSAPTAAAAVAFGAYAETIVGGGHGGLWAVGLIVITSLLHASGARLGGRAHDAATLANLLLVFGFILGGLAAGGTFPPLRDGLWSGADPPRLGDAAVALVIVSFSYSGWNAAAYLAGEVRNPGRTLPRALLLGTAIITALYVSLNAVFLTSAPTRELVGVLEIGHVAAKHLFGAGVAPWVSALIALGLATTVSAAIMTGPRIYERMGLDYPRLSHLARPRSHRGPVRAIALQGLVALVLATTASFDALLTYMGFTLSLTAGLTIAGVFVLRWREPTLLRPYRTFGHPWTTGAAVLLMLWMTLFTLLQRPQAGLAGLATVVVGLLLYGWVHR